MLKGRLCAGAGGSALWLRLSTQGLWSQPPAKTGAFRFPQVTASTAGNVAKERKPQIAAHGEESSAPPGHCWGPRDCQ